MGQQGQGLVVGLLGAVDLKAHERIKALGKVGLAALAALDELVRLDVELLQVVDRQIDATTHGVFAHVANDVGELKGQPQLVRVGSGLGVGLPKNAGRHFAHHTSHQVAVVLQLGIAQVAGLVQVHFAAVNHVQQVWSLDAKGLQMGL